VPIAPAKTFPPIKSSHPPTPAHPLPSTFFPKIHVWAGANPKLAEGNLAALQVPPLPGLFMESNTHQAAGSFVLLKMKSSLYYFFSKTPE